MSGVTLTHRIDDRALRKVLEKLKRKGQDSTEVMADIGEVLLASVAQRFRDEVDPDGNPWTANAEITRARKRNPKVLTESGDLSGSINYRAGRDWVEVGTNKEYGAIHQLGGEAGRGLAVTIPARPFLGVSAADEESIRGLDAGRAGEDDCARCPFHGRPGEVGSR